MKAQQYQFAVVTKNKVVQTVEKSVIYQPKTNPNTKGIKWFDDEQLVKRNKK